MQVSSQEYWSEVRELAVETLTLPADEQMDWLHETIDGHEFVIYTAKALCVLMHTNNDDEVFESGDLADCKNSTAVYSRMAYFAMVADVLDVVTESKV